VTRIEVKAPAKINLTLHVTGQRDDGYHLLDSLVVFADVSDILSVTPAHQLTMVVGGPFCAGVPMTPSNLMMRAAEVMRATLAIDDGAALMLEKNLPHAAGIGSGSSDAAATLAMLAEFWDIPQLPADALPVVALGADVPVCMSAPSPVRMSGIGEVITPVPPLPDCAMVLIRPPVDVPTGPVFAQLDDKNGTRMEDVPADMDFDDFTSWLATQRNDLCAPAQSLASEITEALAFFEGLEGVGYAGMSGSGATCFALVPDMDAADHIAGLAQDAFPGWWVVPTRML